MAIADLYEEAANGVVSLTVNKINLLEVYYGFYRERGAEYADAILDSIIGSVVEVSDVSISVLKEAGRIKSEYRRMSLADSIAIAETSVRGASLVTMDHHEMDVLDKKKEVDFLWFR